MPLSKERKKELKVFTKNVGLKFKNFELLNRAFSHTSYAYEQNDSRLDSYERLEFLGDAVLKLSISDILYSEYENKSEGQLSEKRSVIVSDKEISKFAEKIQMWDFILTGKCEHTNKKSRETILACAFEALLGAIYLEFKDKGYIKAKEFIIKNFLDEILSVDCTNYKANLQELTQKYNHNLPEYVLLEEQGPAHDKTFSIAVYYEDKCVGKGMAKSKKQAEILAAKEAYLKLKKDYEDIENV